MSFSSIDFVRWTKNRETTPCKVEWTPARSIPAALRPGHETKKGPNLIPSRARGAARTFAPSAPTIAQVPLSSRNKIGLVPFVQCGRKTRGISLGGKNNDANFLFFLPHYLRLTPCSRQE
jgi:hypothetical protein